MKHKNPLFVAHLCLMLTSLSVLAGCTDINNPGYSNGGYNSPYYDNSGYDRDYYRRRDREYREQRDLDRERDRLQEERRRLEWEREHNHNPGWRPPPQSAPPPPPAPERCPPGFSPSERKCSAEERKRGCKDVRLPGGLGCVHR